MIFPALNLHLLYNSRGFLQLATFWWRGYLLNQLAHWEVPLQKRATADVGLDPSFFLVLCECLGWMHLRGGSVLYQGPDRVNSYLFYFGVATYYYIVLITGYH